MKNNPFLGNWELIKVVYEGHDSIELFPYGKEVRGILSYFPKGLMTVQLGNLRRPLIEGSGLFNGKADAILRAFNGYVAYFGEYEIDYPGSAIYHHVKQSLYPNWINTVQKRFFEFDGDILYLRAQEMAFGQKSYIPELCWQKLPD